MEKRKRFHLCKGARLVLLVCLPMLVMQALFLTLYIAELDGASVLRESETIHAFLETIARSLVFAVGGTLLLDYLEKKRGRSAG